MYEDSGKEISEGTLKATPQTWEELKNSEPSKPSDALLGLFFVLILVALTYKFAC